MSKTITRFAPSPTGHLHLGGARTAIFNYLFAKHYGGEFLLRIEDTDQERSKDEYLQSILSSLKWLGLQYDQDLVVQSKRNARYLEVAQMLLATGKAYKCFLTADDIANQRAKAESEGARFKLNSPWKNGAAELAGQPFVIRLKTHSDGFVTINDKVQGKVEISVDEIDDQVLVRSNNLATYMLSVVVDDHDMKISDIIRGDDHLTNTAKQILIYQALQWKIPQMYHIPLIHTSGGAKLSKRHGATSVIEYQKDYLPDAMRNYLVTLGWSNPQLQDTTSLNDLISIFEPNDLRKSPSRIDLDRLKSINASNIKLLSFEQLIEHLRLSQQDQENLVNLTPANLSMIAQAKQSILLRSELVSDLPKFAKLYTEEFMPLAKDLSAQLILKPESHNLIKEAIRIVSDIFETSPSGNSIDQIKAELEARFKSMAKSHTIKINELILPIRLAMTGLLHSPSIFEMIAIVGQSITLKRLKFALEAK